jgi:hypothetical protein
MEQWVAKSWNNSGRGKKCSCRGTFRQPEIGLDREGRQPVYRDMSAAPSQYTASIYNHRFGGWRKALEQFVASLDQEQNQLVSYEVEVKSRRGTKRTRRDPSLALRFFVLKRDRFCCVACGRSPATVAGLVLEVDHDCAWSRGGETIEENLKTLCSDCNRGKGAT